MSADQFITALYELIGTCEYGELKGEMLRDRIVVGLRDTTLSERLQLDPDLTLEIAKRTARQKEAVKEHRQELQGDGTYCTRPNPIVVEEVRSGGSAGARGGFAGATGGSSKQGGAPRRKSGTNVSVVGTTTQGQSNALLEIPFVFNAIVRATSGLCFSKTVAATTDHTSLYTVFLGHLGLSPCESSWTDTIQLDDHLVLFKMDTGAEVTAISERDFQSSELKQLEKPNRLVLGPI